MRSLVSNQPDLGSTWYLIHSINTTHYESCVGVIGICTFEISTFNTEQYIYNLPGQTSHIHRCVKKDTTTCCMVSDNLSTT